MRLNKAYAGLGLGVAVTVGLLTVYRAPEPASNNQGPAPVHYQEKTAVSLTTTAQTSENLVDIVSKEDQHITTDSDQPVQRPKKTVSQQSKSGYLEAEISPNDKYAWQWLKEKSPYLEHGVGGLSYDNIVHLLEVLDGERAKEEVVRDIKMYVEATSNYELAVRAYDKEHELDPDSPYAEDLKAIIMKDIERCMDEYDLHQAEMWWGWLGLFHQDNVSALTYDLPKSIIQQLGERTKEYLRREQQEPIPFDYEGYTHMKNQFQEQLQEARARGDQTAIEEYTHRLNLFEEWRREFENGTALRKHHERHEKLVEEVDDILNELLE